MKNILVLGATGNIGIYLVDYLCSHLDRNTYGIIPSGRRNTAYFDRFGLSYVQCDIQIKDELCSKIDWKSIFAVVDLAGILPARMEGYCPQDYIDINVTGTLNVLECCRKYHVEKILFTQSWADYLGYLGEIEVFHPYMEKNYNYTGDHAIYALSKGMAVDMIRHYHEEYGLKNYVFRLPNIYMYKPEDQYFLNGELHTSSYRLMINHAIHGEDIELWGNPNAGKDIVYVKDFCQMVYKAILANNSGGIYNVGTGIKTTMQEQIDGIIDVFCPPDRKSRIIYCPDKRSCDNFIMDIENARQELGYEPQYGYLQYLNDFKSEMQNTDRFKNL